MRPRPLATTAAIVTALLSPPTHADSLTCTASSGAERTSLIELFTSEGCSSCPPADQWLSGFAEQRDATTSLVALAFHVDYWDYIGWRDRYASPAYTERQYQHVRATRGRYAYTPQTVVNGADSRLWREARSPGTWPRTSPPTEAAGADIQLHASWHQDGSIDVAWESTLRANNANTPAVAYLALSENGLASHATAGENSGRTLRHDFVVREWVGPLTLARNGANSGHHSFNRPDVRAQNSAVVLVVETGDTAHTLQALECRPGMAR